MKIVKKLYLSVITLIFVAITFTATTFAWFQINSSASVEGFDFEMQSGLGVVVSSDGVTYGNSITSDEIKKLIVESYDSERYKIVDRKLTYVASGEVVADSEIDRILTQSVLMLPLTSNDGINLTDLYGSASSTKSGRYVEFSIYFKTTSNKVEDNQTYEVYLNGKDTTIPQTGEVIKATSIKSKDVSNVELKASMINNDGSLTKGDVIKVYSSNALRMSVQDTSLETPKATIYEISDDREFEHGSYATDYNGADAELNKLYNADNNAMFTYYNNLRPYSRIEKLKYENKPETVRSLDIEELPLVTTVQSGSDAKLVTFRFWLEGWDADCFDGLAKSISINLTFNSKRVN